MNAHIEKMARGAGLIHGTFVKAPSREDLEAFARLIAEDCAKVAETSQRTRQNAAFEIRERYK